MRVSVIVVTYRKPDRLETCLAALRQQLVPPHEIIVSDDGSVGDDDWRQRRLAAAYGASYLTHDRSATPDGIPCRNTPHVLNAGAAAAAGDVLQFLQVDHIVAPDFLLWLERGFRQDGVMFGLTDHATRVWTLDQVRALRAAVHLPDGEKRWVIAYDENGRAAHREFVDWTACDGMDFAVAQNVWIPLDTRFIGQDHSLLDWMLTAQLRGVRFVINPFMKLWHQDEPPDSGAILPGWEQQLEVSSRQMNEKWGSGFSLRRVRLPVHDARERVQRLLEQS